LLNFLTDRDKILFLCSPNNPSGNCIPSSDIIQLCSIFNGLVVVDEAYIDFANSESLISQIKGHPNLVIIQTLSKAMGAAGIRLGMGFADPYIVGILNKIKPPYNVNSATQKIALDRVNNRKESILQIDEIKNEKKLFLETLTSYDFVLKIFSSEANFVLVRVKDADELYHFLSSNGIVVRNRNKQFRCEGCLRFTIGTPAEMVILNDRLLQYDTQQNKI
ncbi:MAG: aminotransferase class I/II-fold pyridoxal phosphate-dependent enzyme, partial [Saprospiraceae bacterium]